MKSLFSGICALCATVAIYAAPAPADTLTGLFDFKFGQVIGPEKSCDVNSDGELVYTFTPGEPLPEFTEYTCILSPVTRQVIRIRAVAKFRSTGSILAGTYSPYESLNRANSAMSEAISRIETQFNKKATVIERALAQREERIDFSDSNYIVFKTHMMSAGSDCDFMLTIDAHSTALQKQCREEAFAADKIRFADDIRVLALQPKSADSERAMSRISSVFGYDFGGQYSDLCMEKNDSGAWFGRFVPEMSFLGCYAYVIFSTGTTKKAFMVRAVYRGEDFKQKAEEMRRLIERETGHVMEEEFSSLGGKKFRLEFGGAIITIQTGEPVFRLDDSPDVRSVTLDILDRELYQQNEKEHETAELNAATKDVAALRITQTQTLEGLFGVKFGHVMSETEYAEVNNIGELAYSYTPDEIFREYYEYVLFASPVTRKVSQIRAVARMDSSKLDEEWNKTVRILELAFNRKAEEHDYKTKVIFFPKSDYIAVVKHDDRIFIDACCNQMRRLTEQEVSAAAKARHAGALEALAMTPVKDDGTSKIHMVKSVFGYNFGGQYSDLCMEKNDSGTWFGRFSPDKSFMGCCDYILFSTGKTKKAFMVRAVYEGDGWNEKRDDMRQLIELATGHTMTENNGDLELQFGDYLITIETNPFWNKCTLDVLKVSLYKLNEREQFEAQFLGGDERSAIEISY